MPPREPKGRYVRREYFEDDEFQTELTAEIREFYLGIAMFADDAGWLEWKLPYIASFIYRYEGPAERLEKAKVNAKALERTRRLKVLRCGHAQLLRNPGRRVGQHETGVFAAHQSESTRSKPKITRDKDSTLPEPNLNLNLTQPMRAGAREEGGEKNGQPTSLRDLLPDLKPSIGRKGTGR
jgi:hypothetical protein